MRRGDDAAPGSASAGQPRFGDEAEVAAGERRREQVRRIGWRRLGAAFRRPRQLDDRDLLQRPRERADRVDALQEGARRLGVLADPVLEAGGDAQHAERQPLAEIDGRLAPLPKSSAFGIT